MLNGGPLPPSFVSKAEIKGDHSTPEAIAKAATYIVMERKSVLTLLKRTAIWPEKRYSPKCQIPDRKLESRLRPDPKPGPAKASPH